MVSPEEQAGINGASELSDIHIFQKLKQKCICLVKIRWWIISLITACVISAFLLRIDFKLSVILLLLFLIIAFNTFLSFWGGKVRTDEEDKIYFVRKFI
jgi:hypothetical protein